MSKNVDLTSEENPFEFFVVEKICFPEIYFPKMHFAQIPFLQKYTFKFCPNILTSPLKKTPLTEAALLSAPLHCSLTPRAAGTGARNQLILRILRGEFSAEDSHWSRAGGSTNHAARNIFSAESSQPNLNLWCNGWCRNYAWLVGSSFFQINQDWKCNQ